MVDVLQKRAQQRADLLEIHFREWKDVLLVETEMRRPLEARHRQEIILFYKSDSSSADHHWEALIQRQSQEREDFVGSNAVRRKRIRIRHIAEKSLFKTP